VAVGGSLVADLGVGPEVWLFLTLLGCLTIFFKYSRFWSIRNLDLLLLFALSPGMMMLVGNGAAQPWFAYVLLFLGTMLWLARCLIDLGLTRRPLLEPNLNAAGLACLSIGVLGLFVVETVSITVREGTARNPADTNPAEREKTQPPGATDANAPISVMVKNAPLPNHLKSDTTHGLARILACIAQIGLVVGLIAVGWYHYERPIAGLSVATCYLLLPYARFALVDGGQLVPAALIVSAVVCYRKPLFSGALIGVSAAWMPASLGLLPLWTGFYWKRGAFRFALMSLGVFAACLIIGIFVPGVLSWVTVLGARRMREAGLWPTVDAPVMGSFWSGIDASYRLPVWIGYLALVVVTTFWPAEKNLGELISTSAALLVASQFWYLAAGGTLVLLYLPLVILMVFRPNQGNRRPFPVRAKPERIQKTVVTDA
jgi:hypothetical protein